MSAEPKAPRVTKEQMVIDALCRPEGATVSDRARAGLRIALVMHVVHIAVTGDVVLIVPGVPAEAQRSR